MSYSLCVWSRGRLAAGESWPGSAAESSDCGTEPGCAGREGVQGLSSLPSKGWPGGWQPTAGTAAVGGPAGGTEIFLYEIFFKFCLYLTCGGTGAFSAPWKGIFMGLRKTGFMGICWWCWS